MLGVVQAVDVIDQHGVAGMSARFFERAACKRVLVHEIAHGVGDAVLPRIGAPLGVGQRAPRGEAGVGDQQHAVAPPPALKMLGRLVEIVERRGPRRRRRAGREGRPAGQRATRPNLGNGRSSGVVGEQGRSPRLQANHDRITNDARNSRRPKGRRTSRRLAAAPRGWQGVGGRAARLSSGMVMGDGYGGWLSARRPVTNLQHRPPSWRRMGFTRIKGPGGPPKGLPNERYGQ